MAPRMNTSRRSFLQTTAAAAAFAALETKSPVVERFGLRGFGAHSSNAEYVLIDSIRPRLYLAARLIDELS